MKNLNVFAISTLILSFSLSAVAAQPKYKTVAANTATPAQQQKKIDFNKDVDGLGGNDEIMNMANRLNPDAKSRIVQERIVDRHNRVEFGLNYGQVMGGTTYLSTQNIGATLDWHLTPRWSVGVRYYDYTSKLTPEGKRVFDNAHQAYSSNAVAMAVDVDTPQNAKMAVLSWYPIYGKINFFDAAIAQFDIYLLGGGGQIELASGDTSLLTAGAGFGLWMTKHLSARAELRYQNYQDQISTGPRNINAAVGTVGMGWIL